jgi:hypothetical protein
VDEFHRGAWSAICYFSPTPDIPDTPVADIPVQLYSRLVESKWGKLRYWAAQILALLFVALVLALAVTSEVGYGVVGWTQVAVIGSIPIILWRMRGGRVALYFEIMLIVFIVVLFAVFARYLCWQYLC